MQAADIKSIFMQKLCKKIMQKIKIMKITVKFIMKKVISFSGPKAETS
jgi:hypothetical protein